MCEKKLLSVCSCLTEALYTDLSTLISNFITSQTGKQIITIYVLPSITRSTGNQTKKIYSVNRTKQEIFFLKNHEQNVVKKLILNPFLNNQN